MFAGLKNGLQYLRAYWLLRNSSLFDREYYLKNNPDVAQSGKDPIRHYLRYGVAEQRDPSAEFSTSGYLKRYDDVRISGINPLVHYLMNGKEDHRSPDPYNSKIKPEGKQALPISELQNSQNNVLLIDFSGSGGTAVYVNKTIIDKLPDTTTVFHVKYDTTHSNIHVLVFRGDEYLSDGIYLEIEDLIQDLSEINFSDTIVNTLVTWPSAETVLAHIRDLKKHQPNMRVDYKLHDYYCICPSYTLLDSSRTYCGIRCDEEGCAYCVENAWESPVMLDQDQAKQFSITRWRKVWRDFFVDTADTVSVFSRAAEKILLRAYPDIAGKTRFVPHQIPPFKEARIAIIGELVMHKGADVVRNLLRYMEKRGVNDIRFYLFGKNGEVLESPLLIEMGSYRRSELPELLKEHKIDMVFIPSVCPETFCYTAGEALSLGYVTACFDIGGQADQVRASDHGVVLSREDPHYLYCTFKKIFADMNNCVIPASERKAEGSTCSVSKKVPIREEMIDKPNKDSLTGAIMTQNEHRREGDHARTYTWEHDDSQAAEIYRQAYGAAAEIIQLGKLEEGDLLIVGCSTSEVCGAKIGSESRPEVAARVYAGIADACRKAGVWLAAQCCEHLNRALILEKQAALQRGLETVNVVPVPKAGGSFATLAYQNMNHPVAVEHIRADAGLDIGDTFIGMHLREVAVPVRLSQSSIGEAHLTAARTRPKYIGGQRANYDEMRR